MRMSPALDELTEARIRIRICELKVLAAKTTIAVGEIGDLIHQSRSEPYANLVCALLIRRGLFPAALSQKRCGAPGEPLERR